MPVNSKPHELLSESHWSAPGVAAYRGRVREHVSALRARRGGAFSAPQQHWRE